MYARFAEEQRLEGEIVKLAGADSLSVGAA
jgi:hypothetical protein